jgi:hypothetical protein
LKRIDDIEEKLMLEVNATNSKMVAKKEAEMEAVENYMSDIFKHGGTFDSFCSDI